MYYSYSTIIQWMNDTTVSYNNKKKWATETATKRNFLDHIAKWKKLIWKGYILYDSNYKILWKKIKTIVTVKLQLFAKVSGGGEWGKNNGAQGSFKEVKLFCIIL